MDECCKGNDREMAGCDTNSLFRRFFFFFLGMKRSGQSCSVRSGNLVFPLSLSHITYPRSLSTITASVWCCSTCLCALFLSGVVLIRLAQRRWYAKMVDGVGLCAVVVAGTYPLCGGGHMANRISHDDLAVEWTNGAANPPWCFNLDTEHETGAGKTVKNAILVTDPQFLLDPAEFDMPD
jgi:hypothetical protein